MAILGALVMAGLIGVASLVGDYGLALQRQSEDQRIADLAAFAGATVYAAQSGGANALSLATATAKNVASLNGVAASGVNVALTASPADASAQALKITIATSQRLFLAKILGGGVSVTPSASAYAQIGGGASACIVALSASQGVALSGGTALTAPQCAISTNATLSVPCGTTVSAKSVTYNGAAPSQPCNGIATTSLTRQAVTDPLASNAGVLAAESRVASVAGLYGPTAPSAGSPGNTGGTSLSFNLQYWPTTTQNSGPCTASFANNLWTISCPAGASYNFTSLVVASGLGVTLQTTGAGTTNFNFPSAITLSGGAWSFPAANYNFLGGLTIASANVAFQGAGALYVGGAFIINGGASASFQGPGNVTVAGAFATAGSASVSFNGAGAYVFAGGLTQGSSNALNFLGAGTYGFGPGSNACNGASYAICVTNSGALNFAAADSFAIASGLYVAGGGAASFGSGSTNILALGPASDGSAIWLGGGAKLSFAAATSFQIVGNVNADPGGGSCLSLGAATHHDIKGWFSTSGGTILGAGNYTITGFLAFGRNGGGSVWCNGATVGLSGANVTLALGGSSTVASGVCPNAVLCFSAGFNYVALSAPTSGVYAGLLFIAPQSGSSAGASFSGGAGAQASGAFYFPLGAFAMSGGASINSSGGCLQIVALSITLSGGTMAGSTCVSGGSSSTAARLVQ